MKKSNSIRKKAFTLVEMIIVIIIIGILSAVLYPKLAAFINSAKLSSDIASADSLSKSVEQFNTTNLDVDSGLSDGTNDLQKLAGQMVFRNTDDKIVTGSYVADASSIVQNSTSLKDVLKETYGLEPKVFNVGDSTSAVLADTDYGTKKYYILVNVDTTTDTIKGQVMLYCEKTTAFKGNDTYEGMWSRESKKVDTTVKSWIDSLKSNAEAKGYDCVIKAIPYSN